MMSLPFPPVRGGALHGGGVERHDLDARRARRRRTRPARPRAWSGRRARGRSRGAGCPRARPCPAPRRPTRPRRSSPCAPRPRRAAARRPRCRRRSREHHFRVARAVGVDARYVVRAVAARHRRREGILVEHVAPGELCAERGDLRRRGVGASEPTTWSPASQAGRQGTADEAAGPGDEDASQVRPAGVGGGRRACAPSWSRPPRKITAPAPSPRWGARPGGDVRMPNGPRPGDAGRAGRP